jgi:hypothetical protein
MELIKRVIKQSIFVLLLLVILAFFLRTRIEQIGFLMLIGNPRLIPASILIGGVLGILNLRGLVWGIESLLGTHKANVTLLLLNILRLLILFSIITILVAFRLAHLIGLLVGMTVVFFILIKEGLKMARQQ